MEVQRKSLDCKVIGANCSFKGKQITVLRFQGKKKGPDCSKDRSKTTDLIAMLGKTVEKNGLLLAYQKTSDQDFVRRKQTDVAEATYHLHRFESTRISSRGQGRHLCGLSQ